MEQHSVSQENQSKKTPPIQKKPVKQKFWKKLNFQKYLFVYVCLLLPLIFYLGIRILPTLFTFNVGFREWNLLSTEAQPFVGFDNYATLFKDEVFIKAIVNTLIYIVLGVTGQLVFRRFAVITPVGIPSTRAIRMAASESSSVWGKTYWIWSHAGWRLTSESPRSPRSRPSM